MQQITTAGTIETVKDRTPAQEARHQAEQQAKEAKRAQEEQIKQAINLGLKVKKVSKKPITEAPLFGQVNAKQANLF